MTLQNINGGSEERVLDIGFVRSRDPETVLTGFAASCDVLHVMAHGDHAVTPMLIGSDGTVSISLEHLGEAAAGQSWGISSGRHHRGRLQDGHRRVAEGGAGLPTG
ncbi:hypothetical protein [Micromonospora sp. NPDC005173]|uniref:hypothetical protein n=1 Tax=Micromonospora sp. NPDC005173 TaxID=3157165 RepID=UPI00339F2C31